ncbi:MAG TPA: hypothetical protein C5S50_02165 [Methanosarcinaceae archaeon]|nr:hypothetical protein [Methanosarcinaceae archaeon]HJH31001.1 hypothetical protein [Methanosarcinaceae archaeon]
MLTTTVISSTTASAIALTSEIGLPEGGLLATMALILLLSAKEIFSASKKWNSAINASLNIAINPLLITFTLIVIYKVAEII